jgi:hypothetical protein
LTIDWRRSAVSTNSSGDSGSPCLTPLKQLNDFLWTPLSRTEELPVLRMLCIQLVHFSEKPFAFRTSRMTWCSSLSKAFSNIA